MYYKEIIKKGTFAMKKSIFFLLSIAIFTLTSSQAAIYKGQRVFKKKCVECHTDGPKFVAKYDKIYWNKVMSDKGTPLKNLHIKSDKAKKSHAYFSSKKYTKKAKHLKQFLIEYSKGSGNIPAWN